jgi:uncharacterized membrane protein YuzA (DUF378 family)
MWDKLALILLIIGGLNWGLVGMFEFDLVARLFGGSDSPLSRIVYILTAISAIWGITMLFRHQALEGDSRSSSHHRRAESHS